MDQIQKYIVTAIMWCIRDGNRRFSAYTAPQIAELLSSKLGVRLETEEIDSAIRMAKSFDTNGEYFDLVESPFAEDRYYIRVNEPDSNAQQIGYQDVWGTATKLGQHWLQEALGNIRVGLDSGELNLDGGNPIEFKSIPASDRYVSPNDNQAEFDELKEALSEANREIESLNSIEENERLIAISEIALFEHAIGQPRLAHDIIERFLRFCQGQLTKFLGAATSALLISKLEVLLNLFLQQAG